MLRKNTAIKIKPKPENIKSSDIESFIKEAETIYEKSNIKIDLFDFTWPIYRKSLIDDFLFFLQFCDVPYQKKILDVGIGVGLTSFVLSKIGFDVSACDITGLKRNMGRGYNQDDIVQSDFMQTIKFKYSELEEFPFDDVSFDIVFLYAVVEHVEKDVLGSFINEVNRVLRPGGKVFVFKCPQKYSYCEFLGRRFLNCAHDRLWTLKELGGLFSKINMNLIKSEISDLFPIIIVKKDSFLEPFLMKIFAFIERIFILTPFKIFYHNMRCSFVKNQP